MIECKELAGKVIRVFTIFEDGHYGPDIQIEFTDGTRFSACLKTARSLSKPPIRRIKADSRIYSGITAVLPFLPNLQKPVLVMQGGSLLPRYGRSASSATHLCGPFPPATPTLIIQVR